MHQGVICPNIGNLDKGQQAIDELILHLNLTIKKQVRFQYVNEIANQVVGHANFLIKASDRLL